MQVGTFVRNAFGRYFKIARFDAHRVVLVEYNAQGAMDRPRAFSAATFAAYLKNKNFSQAPNFGFCEKYNRWRERHDPFAERAIGANRLMPR